MLRDPLLAQAFWANICRAQTKAYSHTPTFLPALETPPGSAVRTLLILGFVNKPHLLPEAGIQWLLPVTCLGTTKDCLKVSLESRALPLVHSFPITRWLALAYFAWIFELEGAGLEVHST